MTRRFPARNTRFEKKCLFGRNRDVKKLNGDKNAGKAKLRSL